MPRTSRAEGRTGRLRIGDNWNAISIIALSQTNPLKAIAEFVENSIDARAKNITIVRGRERGSHYLRIIDDGEGIRLGDDGVPDFRYVATHICDSIKKRLKVKGIEGIQGEFGIGLLSFWTVGERLVLSSAGADGHGWQMEMRRNEPGFAIAPRRSLFAQRGVELAIQPLLPGLRQLSGERIQNFLASELRDRIRRSGTRVIIRDRTAKKELEVQPRQFTGTLLHQFEPIRTSLGEVYLELYLNAHAAENVVSLFRAGTRVLPSIASLESFEREPWTAGFLQGMIDCPFLQLTPGTRDGVIRDESFASFCSALAGVEEELSAIIAQERSAEEEEASRTILKSVQRALREAILALPREEYGWFDVHQPSRRPRPDGSLIAEEAQGRADASPGPDGGEGAAVAANEPMAVSQSSGREFYEHPGPLYSAVISPATCTMRVGTERIFHLIPRDRSRRTVEAGLQYEWSIVEGEGALADTSGAIARFTAPAEPGHTVVRATVRQGPTSCTADSIVTVTDSLLEREELAAQGDRKGIPGYTFLRAPGEPWRSRFDERANLIVINNVHRDYLFASRKHATKLKYIARLYAKELVLRNFPGFDAWELLERMIELSLYVEENLR